MTSEEQAREIAEKIDKLLQPNRNHKEAVADLIEAALRQREAETWEQAAQECDKLRTGLVDEDLWRSSWDCALTKAIEALRARAAPPHEHTWEVRHGDIRCCTTCPTWEQVAP